MKAPRISPAIGTGRGKLLILTGLVLALGACAEWTPRESAPTSPVAEAGDPASEDEAPTRVSPRESPTKTPNAQGVSKGASPETSYGGPFEELKRKEFTAPRDPEIKLELARRFWCAGEKGVAVEHWHWLKQFDPESSQAQSAEKFLVLVREKRETAVGSALDCAALRP